MTIIERIALAVLVAGSMCYGTARGQGPTLVGAPTEVDSIQSQGVLTIGPTSVEAFLLPDKGDTVFVQNVDGTELAVWDGRTLAGVVHQTLPPGAPIPSPDAPPVLCAHGGEVCVIFVQKNGPYLAAGIVYRPHPRT